MFILKKLRIFYKLILIVFVFLVFLFLFLFALLHYFPLQKKIEMTQSKKFPYLFASWPTKVTDEQAQEMKKWKKYNKAEQKRRLEKQQQQMSMLNSTIYNLFLDDYSSFSSPNLVPVYGKTAFTWPVIPASKVFRNHADQNIKRRSSYLLFPNTGWIQTRNGIYLSSGEELKFDVPVSKERRYLNFNVFPVSEGVLQIFLGQHGWSHVFHEEDIQNQASFSIPIYDSTASNIKIWSSSFNGYLSDVVVNHVLSNARQPIHVSDRGRFWNVDNTLRGSDHLPEEKNPQISVSEKFSTALGYNVILLQVNDVDRRFFDNPKLLSKVAPHISEMMKKSVYFKDISVPESPFDSFRQFAFVGSQILAQKNHMPIVKNAIDQDKEKSTYFRFQKYGYKTLAIAPPQILFFSQDFAKSHQGFDLYTRWLNQSDWNFEKENAEIDEKAQTASGLQAIFKQQEKQIPLPLMASDYFHLSKVLSEASKNLDQIPEWNANEYLFVDPQREYVPMVLESFKRWTLENNRERFFSHIFLNAKSFGDRPFLKDLGKSFSSNGLASIFNPVYLNKMAYLSFVDRAFAQLWDTIQGRHLENRTILFVLFQNKQGQPGAQGMFHISGLQPKVVSFERQVSQNDILATLLSTVGIPSGDNVENLNGYDFGSMLEVNSDNAISKISVFEPLKKPSASPYRKYTMLVKAGTENCRPFEWKSEGASFFGVGSDYPIYSVKDDHSLEIFPCSSQNKMVKISWYQQKGSDLDQSPFDLARALGGRFSFSKDLESLPEFYFGAKNISMEHTVFAFDRLDDQSVRKIFFIGTDRLDESVNAVAKSFAKESKRTRVAFFISDI